jgi:Zn-dependent alcohol dehydrogenase
MRAAFESTRARGAAVMIGIPAPDTILSIPALDVPRGERRVIGSLYGSVRPERDFPLLLDLYRASRLPLDELISHRLPLAEIETGMKLLQSGAALRVVVEPNSDKSR